MPFPVRCRCKNAATTRAQWWCGFGRGRNRGRWLGLGWLASEPPPTNQPKTPPQPKNATKFAGPPAAISVDRLRLGCSSEQITRRSGARFPSPLLSSPPTRRLLAATASPNQKLSLLLERELVERERERERWRRRRRRRRCARPSPRRAPPPSAAASPSPRPGSYPHRSLPRLRPLLRWYAPRPTRSLRALALCVLRPHG